MLIRRRLLGVLAAIAVAALSAFLPGGRPIRSNTSSPNAGIVTGGGAAHGESTDTSKSYIVVYRNAVKDVRVKTDRLQAAEGFRTNHRFSHALRGFSAKLSARQLERLQADPDVLFVSKNRPVKALDVAPLAPNDSAPTGVRRIEAATAATSRQASGVNVAVIDTGIDLPNSDLNAAPGTNCITPGASPADDEGHGTHVAGTIGAKNNGSGVVGVAPGTKVFAVKVLDATGSGTWDSVICGIDWATATRSDADPSNDIAVANMSLGGGGPPLQSCANTTDALHKALCASTAAGVTYVVAAGNSGYDYDYASNPDAPAVYPQVLTVTAVSDSDGLPGGNGGPPTCFSGETDEKYATFSNYATTSVAEAHTIAGPGVCIRSDAPGGTLATMSGTSMATPHVAGAVALCINEADVSGQCGGMSPGQIIDEMRSIAQEHSTTIPAYGFNGDPSRPVSGQYFGYLAWVPPVLQPPSVDLAPPTVSSVSPADGATGVATSASVTVTFNEAMDKPSAEGAFSLVNADNGFGVPGSFSWNGNTMSFTASAGLGGGANHEASVNTGAKDAAGNALSTDKTWSFKTLASVTAAPAAVTIQSGSARSGGAGNLSADDNSFYQVNSTTSRTYKAYWYGTVNGVSNALRTLSLTYRGKNSASCTQTLWIYNWTKGSWVQLDSRSVGTAEVSVQKSPTGTLADFVSGSSGNGDVRIRVRASRTSGRFYSSGDLMTASFTAP